MTEQELLEGLNEEQKQAVLINNGSLLVFAGAGSGKTRVITTKIAYAIEKQIVKPYEILAVTFTNKACREMQERVSAMVEDPETASKPLIRTFHSFGTYLLRKYGNYVGMAENFTIYDDKESLALLKQCFPEEDANTLKEMSSLIALSKEKNDKPNLNSDFYKYYSAYQDALEKSGNADFGDLIVKPISLLKDYPDVLEKVHNRFKYILVDEYQDTNPSQYELLKLLAGPDTFVCVVGDDDQSIYGFRSASVKTILNFPNQFPNTQTVVLGKNYRCTDKILNVAKSIVEKNSLRAPKKLESARIGSKLPVLTQCTYDTDEARFIASEIKNSSPELIGQTAILYRKNVQSKKLESCLSDNFIPYKIVGDVGFYKREETKDLIALMSFVFNQYDPVSFERIVNKPARGIGDSSIAKILSFASEHSSDLISASRQCISQGIVKGAASNGLIFFCNAIEKACKKAGEIPNNEFAYYLASEFGLIDYYSQKDKEEKRLDSSRSENISALINELKEQPYDTGFEGLILFLEKVALESSREDANDGRPRVVLMTMHAAKGLEFKRVFVTGLEQELLVSPRDTKADIEEERRLVYVAMTRAKDELFLSYALFRNLYGNNAFSHKLSFLDDIPSSMLQIKEVGMKMNHRYSYGSDSSYYSRESNQVYLKPKRDSYDDWEMPKPKVTVIKKKIESKPKNTNFKFEVGERVKHDMLGPGTITALKSFGTRDTVVVTFDSGKMGTYLKDRFDFEKLD